jgi:hypothetical protein
MRSADVRRLLSLARIDADARRRMTGRDDELDEARRGGGFEGSSRSE